MDANGNNPARAGNTHFHPSRLAAPTEQLRVCGEYTRHAPAPPQANRNNPACAGNTTLAGWCDHHGAGQPRVCGDYVRGAQLKSRKRGATPRVRGKLVSILFHGRGRRNNPACAGKRLHDQRVYRTTIEFSVNFPKPTRTRQEPIASSRNQHVWFVLDHPAQRRGTRQDRQQ